MNDKLMKIEKLAKKRAREISLREPEDFVQDCLLRGIQEPGWGTTLDVFRYGKAWSQREYRLLKKGVLGAKIDPASNGLLSTEASVDLPARMQESREYLVSQTRGTGKARIRDLLRGDVAGYYDELEEMGDDAYYKDMRRIADLVRCDDDILYLGSLCRKIGRKVADLLRREAGDFEFWSSNG